MRYFVTVETCFVPGDHGTLTTETVYMTERVEMAAMLCSRINRDGTPGLRAFLEAEL